MKTKIKSKALASLSKNLKKYRADRDLSQTILADLSGIEAGIIRQLEAGDIDPKVSIVQALADALGVHISELL